MNNTQIRAFVRRLMDSKELTGITEEVELFGIPLLEETPSPQTTTDWGGREIPQLDEIRGDYDALMDRIRVAAEARGSSYAPPHMPRYHVWNKEKLDDHSYAGKLAVNKNCAFDVQSAYNDEYIVFAWLGEPDAIWSTFIYDRDDAGKIINVKEDGVYVSSIVDDHAVWHKDATPDDMIAYYEDRMAEALLQHFGEV